MLTPDQITDLAMWYLNNTHLSSIHDLHSVHIGEVMFIYYTNIYGGYKNMERKQAVFVCLNSPTICRGISYIKQYTNPNLMIFMLGYNERISSTLDYEIHILESYSSPPLTLALNTEIEKLKR